MSAQAVSYIDLMNRYPSAPMPSEDKEVEILVRAVENTL